MSMTLFDIVPCMLKKNVLLNRELENLPRRSRHISVFVCIGLTLLISLDRPRRHVWCRHSGYFDGAPAGGGYWHATRSAAGRNAGGGGYGDECACCAAGVHGADDADRLDGRACWACVKKHRACLRGAGRSGRACMCAAGRVRWACVYFKVLRMRASSCS